MGGTPELDYCRYGRGAVHTGLECTGRSVGPLVAWERCRWLLQQVADRLGGGPVLVDWES